MSKETRTIRPFIGLESLAPVLEESLLYFGDEPCLPNRSVTVDLDPHQFLLRPVSIHWASDDTAFEHFKETLIQGVDKSGFNLDDLSLVVVATTPYLKMAEVVLDLRLSAIDDLKRESSLIQPSRPAVFDTPHSGFSVDAYVLLNRTLEARPLRPHIKATWLGRVGFRVETTLGPAVLPPTPLTQEIREQYGLDAKTIRYLHLGDHDPLEPYLGQEQPIFYVDDDILSQLNARRSAPLSRALQVQLAHDFVAAVVRRASSEQGKLQGLSYEDLRRSLLGSVIRIAAGSGATDDYRERLVDDVCTRPELVLAHAEHNIGMKEAYLGALKEEDS